MIFDRIENIENYKGSSVFKALEFLKNTDFADVPPGRYELSGGSYYMVQEYMTDPDKNIAEAHKEYIDIQFMLNGRERVGYAPISAEKKEVEAKPGNDVWFYECETEFLTLAPGCFAVLYPCDLHMPGTAVSENTEPCRKVVVKVKVKE